MADLVSSNSRADDHQKMLALRDILNAFCERKGVPRFHPARRALSLSLMRLDAEGIDCPKAIETALDEALGVELMPVAFSTSPPDCTGSHA
jgi:hypothetical protein